MSDLRPVLIEIRELAALCAPNVATSLRRLSDVIEHTLANLADRLHGAEVGAAILRDRLAAVVPGEQYRVFCAKHDEHKARYHDGRPMLNDQCPTCVIESQRAAHEPRTLPEPPSSMEDILEWIRSMSDDDAIKNMVGVAIEKWTAIQARASQPPLLARPLDEWHEDMGDVVWWKFPVDEPAWIGSPLASDWPGYHTHWTPHPQLPECIRCSTATKEVKP